MELAANVDAKDEIVRQIIVTVGDAFRFRRKDRAFAQIGTVAQPVDFVLFLGRVGAPIVDMFQRIDAAPKNASPKNAWPKSRRSLGRRIHSTPPTKSTSS